MDIGSAANRQSDIFTDSCTNTDSELPKIKKGARNRLAWFYVLGIAAPFLIFGRALSVLVHESAKMSDWRFAADPVSTTVFVAIALTVVLMILGRTIYRRSVDDSTCSAESSKPAPR